MKRRIVTKLSRIVVSGVAVIAFAAPTLPQQQGSRFDVPPVPSPPEVVTAIIQLASLNRKSVLVDLGCGDGRIVLAAAKSHARAICVEIDSYILERARRAAQNANLAGQIEFRHQDLKEFVRDTKAMASLDVVVLYLTPELNKQIAPDLARNLKRGAKVISHAYPVEPWKPKEIKPVRIKSTGNTSRLYVYEISKRTR